VSYKLADNSIAGNFGLNFSAELRSNRPGFEDLIHPRHRRGGGNRLHRFRRFVGRRENSTIVFQAFHEPSLPRRASITANSQGAICTVASIQSCSNCTGLT
jgi:hypothetical protein